MNSFRGSDIYYVGDTSCLPLLQQAICTCRPLVASLLLDHAHFAERRLDYRNSALFCANANGIRVEKVEKSYIKIEGETLRSGEL